MGAHMTSYWNHRVIRTVDDETLELTLQITEVFYNDKGVPYSYGEPFLTGEDLSSLATTVDRLKAALEQPVLAYPGDFDFDAVPDFSDEDDDTPVAPT
jgi:hypothetical protein